MAISPATAAASRIMAHGRTPLQTLIRRHLLPVQLMNGSTGSLLASPELRTLRGPDGDSIENHRSTGSLSSVQFRFGLAVDRLGSQARIEARGRPVKIDDDFSDDGDFSDGGDSDDGGFSDDDDGFCSDKYLSDEK